MSQNDPRREPISSEGGGGHRRGSLVIVVLVMGLLVAAFLAVRGSRSSVPPAPPEIANDPFLSQGRDLYLRHCGRCHGANGTGDGPMVQRLRQAPPGDLTDGDWKFGGQPDQIMAVIRNGVEGSPMVGYEGTISPEGIRAVTAYLHTLADQPVPESLRPSERSNHGSLTKD